MDAFPESRSWSGSCAFGQSCPPVPCVDGVPRPMTAFGPGDKVAYGTAPRLTWDRSGQGTSDSRPEPGLTVRNPLSGTRPEQNGGRSHTVVIGNRPKKSRLDAVRFAAKSLWRKIALTTFFNFLPEIVPYIAILVPYIAMTIGVERSRYTAVSRGFGSPLSLRFGRG